MAQTIEVDGTRVELRRSARRRRTVQARQEDGTVVLMLPAGMAAAEELRWARTMVARIRRQQARRRPPAGDEELSRRARTLAAEHLDPVVGRPVRPVSVRWVTNQNHRWGSCTPAEGTIRLSHRLQQMPDWVVDHVLLHELAHLVEPHHSPRFHELAGRTPQAERATGYLEGWSAARGGAPGGEGIDED